MDEADPSLIVKTLSQYATEESIRRILHHEHNIPWVSAP
jgi:hypothetical protein